MTYPLDQNKSVEDVVSSDSPIGIALDLSNDHLYWTEYFLNRIMRSNLDGSQQVTILDSIPFPNVITITDG